MRGDQWYYRATLHPSSLWESLFSVGNSIAEVRTEASTRDCYVQSELNKSELDRCRDPNMICLIDLGMRGRSLKMTW